MDLVNKKGRNDPEALQLEERIFAMDADIDAKGGGIPKNGWDKAPVMFQGRGDGTIPSKAAEWVCDNWDHKNTPKICIDLDNHDRRFDHQPLTYNPFIHELIFNLTSQSDWVNFTGRSDYHLPYIKILKNNTYQIRSDIRPLTQSHID